MKRSFIIFALCFLVIACGVGASAWHLHQDRNQVAVTAEVLAGDISAAEGFAAHQTAHMQGRLLWDMTIPLGNPEDAETDYSYHIERVNTEMVNTDPLNIELFDSVWQSAEDWSWVEAEIPALNEFYRGAAERAPADGELYTEFVFLEDYVDTYPVLISCHATGAPSGEDPEGGVYGEIRAMLEDYFTFPLPPGATWGVSLRKMPDGTIRELAGFPGHAKLELLGTWRGDSFLCAFAHNRVGNFSFDQIPGGSGVYRLDLEREGETIQGAAIETICSFPSGAEVLALTLSGDGEDLLALYCLGNDYFCLVLDPETGAERQRLPVPAPPPQRITGYYPGKDGESIPYPYPQWTVGDLLVGENFFLVYGTEEFYLYEKKAGAYAYVFSAPAEDLQFDPYFGVCTGAWNGEGLALGQVGLGGNFNLRPPGLELWVFQAGELVCQGKYTTSLSEIAPGEYLDDEDADEFLDDVQTKVWVAENNRLTLTCKP